jgi:hypothetical protein
MQLFNCQNLNYYMHDCIADKDSWGLGSDLLAMRYSALMLKQDCEVRVFLCRVNSAGDH